MTTTASNATGVSSNVSRKRSRSPLVLLMTADLKAGRRTPPKRPPAPTENPRVPCVTAERESPPKTTAMSPEEMGSQASQPLPNPIQKVPREGAGVLPPEQQPSNAPEVPPQRAAVADPKAEPPELPPAGANAVIDIVRVRPGHRAKLQYFPLAQRLVKSQYGVKMGWGRHDLGYWYILYVGPKHLLEEASFLGQDCLINPDSYNSLAAKEHGEFASVTKW